jgi:hypothetical protein
MLVKYYSIFHIKRGIIMKFKALFATLALSAIMCSTAFAQDISVSLNGSIVNFPNQQPTVVDGRTLIPLRGLFDTMGYSIDWNGETKTVTLEKNGSRISVQIGEKAIYLDGSPIEIDVPAQIINGSTMLPLRAVADASSSQVLWDNETKIATIIATDLVETKLEGVAVPESKAEEDYLNTYTSLYSSYNVVAQDFINLGQKLMNNELQSETDMQNAITTVQNLHNEALNMKNKLSAITPPQKYQAFHNKTIEYMQVMADMGELYSDLFTDNFESEAELTERLNKLGTEGSIIENDFKTLFAQIFN